MRMLYALFIFIGFSFTGFVVMMNKSATLSNLTVSKAVVYALITTAVNAMALLAGYVIFLFLSEVLSAKTAIITGYLILFGVGMFLTVSAYHRRDAEEKADRSFDGNACFRLAVRNCPGIVLIGAGCFILGVSLVKSLCIVSVLTFVFILAAIAIGYQFGSGFSRTVGMTGGIIMMIFTLVRFLEYMGKIG